MQCACLLHVAVAVLVSLCVQDQYSFVHDALVEFIRSGGDTEIKDVNVAQYVRQLTTPDDDGKTSLHIQYQVFIHTSNVLYREI